MIKYDLHPPPYGDYMRRMFTQRCSTCYRPLAGISCNFNSFASLILASSRPLTGMIQYRQMLMKDVAKFSPPDGDKL